MRRLLTSTRVGWACTLMSVAVVAVWVLSRQLCVVWFLDFDSPRPPLGWLPSWRVGSGWIEIGIPYWMALAPVLAVAACFWHGKIRRKTGMCPGCGYDRHGIAAHAKCPE